LKARLNPYLFLFLILLIGYFPVSTFFYGVKNDILTGYLPVRFFISESLASGNMPWWNPYVNFGIPQYADMSSSFWSPVTWLIAGTIGYNVYTITIELLLYILIGAWGMYKCGDIFGWSKEVKLIAAISYMCSGYIVGHLQHLNWVSGAGFLPWCLWAYHLMLTAFSWKRILKSVFFFYLLLSASHPGIIISSMYFFGCYTVYLLILNSKKNRFDFSIWVFSKSILLFLFIFLLIGISLIVSYTEILPFITRGDRAVIENPALNATTIQSWISFLFPFAIVKNDAFFHNDIALRNCYFGVILFTFLISSFNLKRKETLFFFITGFFFLFLSANNFIQIFCYKYLPLLGYVRLNGEFRIFALFCFIITAASNLQHYLNVKNNSKGIKRILFFLTSVSFVVIIWSFIKLIFTKESIVFSSLNTTHLLSASFLKSVIDQLSFYDVLVLQGTIQLLLLLLTKRIIHFNKPNYFLLIVILDLCTATLLQIPFTGVGTKSSKEIQTLLNASPKGIPVPALKPIILNDQGSAETTAILGNWSFYNKKPGTNKHSAYPIQFKNEEYLFQSHVMHFLEQKSFLFFSSNLPDSSTLIRHLSGSANKLIDSGTRIELLAFNPNNIQAKLIVNQPGDVVLLYQDYPNWKYTLNGQSVQHETYLKSFSKINISKPGVYTVSYSFSPDKIKIFAIVSFITFILLLISLLLLPATTKDSILQQ